MEGTNWGVQEKHQMGDPMAKVGICAARECAMGGVAGALISGLGLLRPVPTWTGSAEGLVRSWEARSGHFRIYSPVLDYKQ